MTQKLTLLRKFFSDNDGKLAIAQAPNVPLLIWLACTVLSYFLSQGDWLTLTRVVGKGAIIIWAVLEVYSGTSPFRRVLGIVVLILSVVTLL